MDGSPLSATGVDMAAAALTAYRRDAVAVGGSSIGPSGTVDDQSRVEAGTTSAASGAPVLRTLPGTRAQIVTALAGNARGDIALSTRGLRSRLIFLRRAGTDSFGRVLTIPVSSEGRGVTVALSPAGELLVAWEDRHEVFARHRGPHATWGAVQDLGRGVQSDLQAATDSTGRMMVAWKSQRIDEGEASEPAIVSFVTAAPGRGFDSRRQLESVGPAEDGRAVGSPGVRLALTGRDTALLAWTGFDGAHFVVRAAPLDRGHVGPRQQLSTAGTQAVLGDLATAPDGQALVLWRANVLGSDQVAGLQPQLLGNVRPADAATFDAPEAIGGAARSVFSAPTAAVDGVTGDSIAVFSDFATTQVLASARPTARP